VDYGSEFRYRNPIVDERTLTVASASRARRGHPRGTARGEAERLSTIAICNVMGSMVTREAQGRS